MTNSSSVGARYRTEYAQQSSHLPGQNVAWLVAQRQAALERIAQAGFPTTRDENWRYTSLAGLEKKSFLPRFTTAEQSITIDDVAPYYLPDCYNLVLLNGRFVAALSQYDVLPDALRPIALSNALACHETSARLRDYWSTTLSEPDHRLIDCNTLWFSDGFFWELPVYAELDKPLHWIHWVTKPESLIATRHIIVLQQGAKAMLIQSYVGTAAYFHNTVNDIVLQPDAALTLYTAQYESPSAYHFSAVHSRLAEQSVFEHHHIALGSLLARQEILVDLASAARCALHGVYWAKHRQHLDQQLSIHHRQACAQSHVDYKGIADDKARGVFQGKIIVQPQAQHTDAVMNNRNLLLSPDAEIDTKPQLEIYADDVKCSHGVTVGQLEEQAVFYLQARAIDETTARAILLRAFAQEKVDQIAFDPLRERLTGWFDQISHVDG